MNRIARASMCSAVVGITLATAGCGGRDAVTASMLSPTTYEARASERFPFGYHDEDLGNDKFKITTEVTSISPREDAIAMAKVRAAEIAKERGFPQFAVLSARATTRCISNGGTTHSGMPRLEMTVQLLKEEKEGKGIYEADAVLTELRSHVMAPNYTYEQKRRNLEVNQKSCFRGFPLSDEDNS